MLAQWFGPKGVTTTVLRHELQPGGLLHARMDVAGGGTMWARFVYRAVEPPARLVWAACLRRCRGRTSSPPPSAAPGRWSC